MNKKQWDTKLGSLLRSLDIDNKPAEIDEIEKFGKTKDDVEEKIFEIVASYIKSVIDTNLSEGTDFSEEEFNDEFDESGAFPTDPNILLNAFFNELSKNSEKEQDPKSDNLKQWELIFNWFEELLFINKGQFRIMKNESDELVIIFSTDEIKSKGKVVSITDELLASFKDLNIYYKNVSRTKSSPKKQSSVKKQKPTTKKEDGTERKKRTYTKKTKDKGSE